MTNAIPRRKQAPPSEAPRIAQTRPKLFEWKFFVALAVVLLLLAASLLVGEYDIFNGELGAEMFAITRIPRTVALVLSGAALAMCGLVMQMLTQNRFVEPTTTGVTEWAGLGLLLTLLFIPTPGVMERMIGAVLFSFVGSMVFFLFLRRVALRSSLVVPIIGIMLGAVVSSISSFIGLKFDLLQSLGVWFAGSFTSVYKGQYEVLWIVVFVVAMVFVYADRLTVAGLGEDFATTVGLNYQRLMLIGTILVSLAVGVVTVVVGYLPFVGLIVPNIVSKLRGDDLRSNLPWVVLTGIAVVALCDLIARTVISPFEIPVSVVLGIVGAVVFAALILRGRGRA